MVQHWQSRSWCSGVACGIWPIHSHDASYVELHRAETQSLRSSAAGALIKGAHVLGPYSEEVDVANIERPGVGF